MRSFRRTAAITQAVILKVADPGGVPSASSSLRIVVQHRRYRDDGAVARLMRVSGQVQVFVYAGPALGQMSAEAQKKIRRIQRLAHGSRILASRLPGRSGLAGESIKSMRHRQDSG
jgi:hypothetical protein